MPGHSVKSGSADFYPRPPRGGRLYCVDRHIQLLDFYPRPPRGGRRGQHQSRRAGAQISIHALREEGDVPASRSFSCRSQFLSTPSARRATCLPAGHFPAARNFYPRPPRGGRRLLGAKHLPARMISIHALREEGDKYIWDIEGTDAISIHALREEGDKDCWETCCIISYFYPRPPRGGRQLSGFFYDSHHKFLSTPSARRATSRSSFRSRPAAYFYPRPPRGGRPEQRLLVLDGLDISIHALREEGDQVQIPKTAGPRDFYPRPPRGGRPADRLQCAQDGHFYPRPPRGGRLPRRHGGRD